MLKPTSFSIFFPCVPALKIEMDFNNNARDRKIKQYTRAWAVYVGTNYTTALRRTESPLAQGALGERVSARQLINTLNDHQLAGADDGDFVLGEAGFYADTQWSFNRTSDFIELALVTDFLRVFTPVAPGDTPSVSSYSLKHTAEKNPLASLLLCHQRPPHLGGRRAGTSDGRRRRPEPPDRRI